MSHWKRPVALALSIGLAGPALAALPPKWQRAQELHRVIEEAARALAAPVDAIERIDDVLYKVSAGTCHLFVRVVFEPSSGEPRPGSQSFKAIPGVVQCP